MSYFLLSHWTKKALFALVGIALMYSWIGFKFIEPKLFPVVSDFQIKVFRTNSTSLFIAGVMRKDRDCDIKYMTVYDNSGTPPRMLDIEFSETANIVNRQVGYQAYGDWIITPKSKNIIITAHHACSTGEVKTVLFNGVVQ